MLNVCHPEFKNNKTAHPDSLNPLTLHIAVEVLRNQNPLTLHPSPLATEANQVMLGGRERVVGVKSKWKTRVVKSVLMPDVPA